MTIDNDILDNEIRVIGPSRPAIRQKQPSTTGKTYIWMTISTLVTMVTIAMAAFLWIRPSQEKDIPDTSTDAPANGAEIIDNEMTAAPEIAQVGTYPESSAEPYAEYKVMTVGETTIDIYIPHNAVPKLAIGNAVIRDENVVMAFQAADVRADNGKIVGAFVLAGEPIAWGLSKKGYCAIIEGKITIGTAANSPLFEEATEKGGYFFRQYALVDNGVPVKNQQTSSAIRKALCSRAGEIFVAIGRTPMTINDFSQALASLGVENAIYLMGGGSYGFYRTTSTAANTTTGKTRIDIGLHHRTYQYENYIYWSRE